MSEKIIKNIVNRLFTNGFGQKAERLILKLEGNKDGGGWCKSAVEDVLREEINARPSAWVPTSERPPEFFFFRDSLFSHHKARIQTVPDAKAQMIAITGLFDAGFTEPDCLMCYDKQVSELQGAGGWRSKVSWLTVKQDIGDWIAQGKPMTPKQLIQSQSRVGQHIPDPNGNKTDEDLRRAVLQTIEVFAFGAQYDDSDLESYREYYSAEEWQRFCAIYEEEKTNYVTRDL